MWLERQEELETLLTPEELLQLRIGYSVTRLAKMLKTANFPSVVIEREESIQKERIAEWLESFGACNNPLCWYGLLTDGLDDRVGPHPACRGGAKVRNQNVSGLSVWPPPRLPGWSQGSTQQPPHTPPRTSAPPRQAGWGPEGDRITLWLRTLAPPRQAGWGPGWVIPSRNAGRRVHGSVIHIDIRGGKVWIESNGTDARIGEELVAAGIPRQDIVLGFQPAAVRPLTWFGVG